MQPRALGRKVSDEFAVPLCRGHHRAVHHSRDERAWWKQAGIDPIKVARRLWKETRGLGRRRRVAAPASEPIPKNEDISAIERRKKNPPIRPSRLAGSERLDARGDDNVET
jgi:hypothetical protein